MSWILTTFLKCGPGRCHVPHRCAPPPTPYPRCHVHGPVLMPYEGTLLWAMQSWQRGVWVIHHEPVCPITCARWSLQYWGVEVEEKKEEESVAVRNHSPWRSTSPRGVTLCFPLRLKVCVGWGERVCQPRRSWKVLEAPETSVVHRPTAMRCGQHPCPFCALPVDVEMERSYGCTTTGFGLLK